MVITISKIINSLFVSKLIAFKLQQYFFKLYIDCVNGIYLHDTLKDVLKIKIEANGF